MADETELLLAQVWHAQWLAESLRTVDGAPLRVVYRGVWTHGFGPDFAGARLDLGGRLVAGDVEVHLRSSAWFAHGHHLDPRYNGVVLHVSLDHDLEGPVRRQDGATVPVLALRPHLPAPLERFPVDPDLRPLGAIGFAHCAPRVAAEAPEALRRVWEAAGDARMAAKVAAVGARLAAEPPGQALYGLLLDALGYSRNREGMRAVAARLPYDHLEPRLVGLPPAGRRERAAALLLGVGGFLPLAPAEAALAELSSEEVAGIERAWARDGAPWRGLSLPPTTWTLARQRPAAHPLRRLLALAWLLARLEVGLLEDLCARIAAPNAQAALLAWLAGENPHLGVAHAHEIVVNVAVPFALAYAEASESDDLARAAAALWERLPAGRGNAEVRAAVEQICGPHRVRVGSARAEQGLLQIRRAGCAAMRCYECPVARLALGHEEAGSPA